MHVMVTLELSFTVLSISIFNYCIFPPRGSFSPHSTNTFSTPSIGQAANWAGVELPDKNVSYAIFGAYLYWSSVHCLSTIQISLEICIFIYST